MILFLRISPLLSTCCSSYHSFLYPHSCASVELLVSPTGWRYWWRWGHRSCLQRFCWRRRQDWLWEVSLLLNMIFNATYNFHFRKIYALQLSVTCNTFDKSEIIIKNRLSLNLLNVSIGSAKSFNMTEHIIIIYRTLRIYQKIFGISYVSKALNKKYILTQHTQFSVTFTYNNRILW